jgi:hypothetical protein
MNRPQRLILVIASALMLAMLGAWGAMGFQIFTKTEIPVQETDELLGLTTVVWKKTFLLGLDYTVPALLVLALLAGILLYVLRTHTGTRTPSSINS